jgi:hypothetical protein
MMTKDYVYLGLIALAAAAFYWNGFYAGVCQSRKTYETLLNDRDDDMDAQTHRFAGVNSLAESDDIFTLHKAARESNLLSSKRGLRGDFGNN